MKVYYWKDIHWMDFFDINFESDEDGVDTKKPICFLKRIFDKEWVEMPIELGDCQPEEVFSILNRCDNPLDTDENQSWIKKNGLRHTSMSVGDIIQTAEGYFVCMVFGWRRIRWCDNRERRRTK